MDAYRLVVTRPEFDQRGIPPETLDWAKGGQPMVVEFSAENIAKWVAFGCVLRIEKVTI